MRLGAQGHVNGPTQSCATAEGPALPPPASLAVPGDPLSGATHTQIPSFFSEEYMQDEILSCLTEDIRK